MARVYVPPTPLVERWDLITVCAREGTGGNKRVSPFNTLGTLSYKISLTELELRVKFLVPTNANVMLTK